MGIILIVNHKKFTSSLAKHKYYLLETWGELDNRLRELAVEL